MRVSSPMSPPARPPRFRFCVVCFTCSSLVAIVFGAQADNAGFDATDLLNRLRQKHARDGDAGKWFGVDVDTEGERGGGGGWMDHERLARLLWRLFLGGIFLFSQLLFSPYAILNRTAALFFFFIACVVEFVCFVCVCVCFFRIFEFFSREAFAPTGSSDCGTVLALQPLLSG